MHTSNQSGDHAPACRLRTAAIADARAMIDARKDEWTRLLRDLIRIPSCFEAEHDVVRYVREYISAAGLTPVLVPMDAGQLRRFVDSAPPFSEIPGRNNIVVRVPGCGGGRSLILNSHLDIQPAGDLAEWTHPPYAANVDAKTNTIYGRGAMDDKAGVAICLALMRVIVEQGLAFAGDVLFQFVLEDETTGNGSLLCLEAGHTADAAIILDGTRPDRAIDQHAGNMEFHITAKGQPASVSVSHLGSNAAELLLRVLLHLRDAFFRLNATRQPPWTEFPSPFQFVIHGLAADAPQLCVPVEASARCFVTFPPPATIEGIRALLREEADRHAKSNNYPHPPVFCWDGLAAEPVSSASDELRSLVSDTAGRNGIRDIRIAPSTGTSDLRHFAKRGIPCLLYGPGRGFNPHRADERFMLDDVPAMMKLYLDMISEWCKIT
jgi:acetylornithine deacetylase